MRFVGRFILPALLVVMLASIAAGQRSRRRDSAYQSDNGEVPSAREAIGDGAGYPKWEYEPRFRKDVFTFVRIEYDVDPEHPGHTPVRWTIDFPDSELNFSYRLQQMTSLKVDPNPIHLRITDKRLFDYPFIYIIEPGKLKFSEEEVEILRKYLFNGGFLMFDDFWGEWDWEHFYVEIKRVFPDREPTELALDHPIFHTVFDLKEKPQIPNVDKGTESQWTGITWERDDAKEVHYKGIFDDKNRLMVMICHNTDLGDGWEREGENEYYFHEFSEKKAYPLGINIVFYAMTH
jgi:hypothetical protein